MDKRTVGVVALIAVAVGIGLLFPTYHHNQRQHYRTMLHDPSPRARVSALRQAAQGVSAPPPDLVAARVCDEHHFVRSMALEAVYRQGLCRFIGPARLRRILVDGDEQPELARRWLVAVVLSIDYERGFDRAVRELPSMKSPFSRPFLVQLLVLHGEGNAKALAYLESVKSKPGLPGKEATHVLALLGRAPQRRRFGYLPPPLRITKIPEQQ